MNSRTMEKLQDMMCDALDRIAEKGSLSTGDLEVAHKLTDTIKNLNKIEMLQGGGYSQRGNSYDGGNSYGHYVRGHYSRDGENYSNRGYYRDSEGSMEKLRRMLDQADSETERQAIRKCMSVMQ